MTDIQIEFLSRAAFGFAILVIILLAFKEWQFTQIKAEKDEIALGEKENEDKVNSLTPDQLIDLVNNGIEPNTTQNDTSVKKPTGSV